jgi:mRNA-degrading endonuclease RelE of RelBE toxin-antitoxin system
MKWQHSNRSKQDYNNAPLNIQKAFDKQARLLAENLRHPSIQAKKIDQTNDVWQGRVNQDWRFFFQIVDDTYVIVRIIPHPK